MRQLLKGENRNLLQMERKTSRKLSTDMHRKLSAISTCSNVSDISLRLGMDPNDFKSTIQNILDLDVGDAWELESEDGLSCYGDEAGFDDVPNDFVTVQVEQRKSSTGSQVSTDSLDTAESFEPVKIDMQSIKGALNMYQRHKKISMSRVVKPPTTILEAGEK
eukprot:maker-scaffold55_size446313-snap-gene-1.16 protein:Tk00222 transcript:maker-scaffold55_size446313-snap-gene-1.16-mRNA-1 annotation:"hypothetical protein DAPPUDRAFT_308319"